MLTSVQVWAAALAGAALLGGCASSTIEPPLVAGGRGDPCLLPQNPDPSKIYRVPRSASDGRSRTACNIAARTISVHDQGQLRPTYGALPETPVLPSQVIDPVIATLKAASAKLEPGQPLKVLVFVHGGLVEHAHAVASAEALAPGMRADGFEPVFLIWESSMARSYWDRLCCVTNGVLSVGGKSLFVPIRLAGDLGASLARAPENYDEEFTSYRDSVLHPYGTGYQLRSDDEANLCRQLLGDGAESHCLNLVYPAFDDKDLNRLDQSLKAATVRHAAFFPVRLVGVAALPEVGTEAWDNMIRRTRLAVLYATAGPLRPSGLEERNCERLESQADEDVRHGLLPDKSERPADRFKPVASGGFALFFERLDCEYRNNAFRGRDGSAVDVQLYFYGHSMGAIVGDEVIWRYPNLPWKRVVYMAAADSIRDFRTSVMPQLFCPAEGRAPNGPCAEQVQFYSLMLHPLAEARELNVGGLPPQGSLLEWIDQMFGGPRTSDDRTFGKWTNVEDNIQLFRPVARQRMFFRVFPSQADLRDGDAQEQAAFYRECAPAPGTVFPKDAGKGGRAGVDGSRRCHPVKHGEFTDYSFWRESYLGQ
jgi:hypothetical protein